MVNLREDVHASETGLFVAEEASPGKLPANPIWFEHDPNSYDDFGAQTTLVARNPINRDRMDKKGTVVGLNVPGGWEEDLTIGNFQEYLQGFFFADMRRKSEFTVASFAADGINLANGGLAYLAGTILAVKGALVPANNGMKVLGANATSNKIPGVFTASADDKAIVSRVGHQFAAGDLSVDVTGSLPRLVSAAKDLTVLGLIPGEMIFIGGDAAATRYADTSFVNGWARVFNVTANAITFDKTDAVWQAVSGVGKTVQLFFGRVLKNETRALIKGRTYALRRILGAPDLDDPNRVQSEVIYGSTPGELTFDMPEENKITCAVATMGRSYKAFPNDADIAGTKVKLPEEDAVNTSRDAVRARMAVYPKGGNNSAPTPLFSVFENFNLTVNNNLTENKAVTRFGTFSITPGNFSVSGEFTGYFVGVESTEAVANSSDVTFDFVVAKGNKGVAWDIPMIGLSSDGVNIEPNQSIKVDLDASAASGVKYHPDFNHTLMMVFFDYLPSAAMVD